MRNKDHSNSASGPDYFGFTSSTIAKLIQDLPNADKCKNYRWQKVIINIKIYIHNTIRININDINNFSILLILLIYILFCLLFFISLFFFLFLIFYFFKFYKNNKYNKKIKIKIKIKKKKKKICYFN